MPPLDAIPTAMLISAGYSGMAAPALLFVIAAVHFGYFRLLAAMGLILIATSRLRR